MSKQVIEFLFPLLAVAFMLVAVFRQRKQRDISELPTPSDEVISLAKSGDKVRAIKAYRRQGKMTLYEAHSVILRFTPPNPSFERTR
jgi:ribosomal protein L7/L12